MELDITITSIEGETKTDDVSSVFVSPLYLSAILANWDETAILPAVNIG